MQIISRPPTEPMLVIGLLNVTVGVVAVSQLAKINGNQTILYAVLSALGAVVFKALITFKFPISVYKSTAIVAIVIAIIYAFCAVCGINMNVASTITCELFCCHSGAMIGVILYEHYKYKQAVCNDKKST